MYVPLAWLYLRLNFKDTIMSIILKSPNEVTKEIAKRVQQKRLSYNWSQNTLASRSGVSYGTLKKFERTGQISLESLLKIALVLDSIKKFDQRLYLER